MMMRMRGRRMMMGGMGGDRGSIMIVEIDVLSSVMNEDLKYEVHDER